MSKLTAYLITGQPVGVSITSWEETDLNGNPAFLVEDAVTSGYQDISSIENWDNLGELATDDCSMIRNEIKAFYDATTFSSLTSSEKEVVSRWFVSTKSERDTIKTEEEQIEDAKILSDCLSKSINDNVVDSIVQSDGGNNSEINSVYNESTNLVTSVNGMTGSVVVTSTFGSDYLYVDSEGESATNSSTWQQKLRMTTPSLSGTYRISWYSEITNSNTSSDIGMRLQINDSTTISEIEFEPEDSNAYEPQSGFYVTTLSGVQNIDMDFSGNGNGTGRIRRARIEIMRIS